MYNEEQSETQEKLIPPTVGQIIREYRQKAKIPIEKMSRDTKIRLKYLQAIEEDNFQVIPEPVAARGFIKISAKYLGIDEVFINQRYREQRGHEQLSPLRNTAQFYAQPIENKNKWFFFLVSAIFIVVAIVFVTWLISHLLAPINNSHNSRQVLDLTPMVAVPSPAITAGDEQKIARLTVKAFANAWLRVTVDGQSTFHGMIGPNETKIWQGRDKIIIKTPQPQNLQLIFNDKDQGRMETKEKVSEQIFQAETI